MSFILITTFLNFAIADKFEGGASRDEPATPAKVAATDERLAEQFASLKRQIDARTKELSSELAAARKAGGRGPTKEVKDVIARYQRDHQVISDRITALVRAHPADPAALDGILLLGGDADDDILRIVSEHFLNEPRLVRFCAPLAARSADPLSKELLKEIATKSPDRQTRGEATYSLGLALQARCKELMADQRLSESDQEQLLTRTARRLYKQRIAGGRLSESHQNLLLGEAQVYFEQVVSLYPDVTSADGKFRLADRAKAEMRWIANLPGLKVGKIAPGIVGEDLDGEPLKLEDYRGKVVVVVFWATWCAPCMEMVPHERELVRRMVGKPFALIGVNADETGKLDKARKAARDEQMSWRSFRDGLDGPIQRRYNVDHYPTIYVLDPQGVIRNIDVRGKELDRAVERLLSGMEAVSAPPPR